MALKETVVAWKNETRNSIKEKIVFAKDAAIDSLPKDMQPPKSSPDSE